MAIHYKTQGFVFKKEDQGEADRIFSLFTEDFGRLEVTGKAIRKITSKLRGGIDIFYLCNIEFIQGKHKKTLTDAVAVQLFRQISNHPEKMEIAKKISDVADRLIKGQEKQEDILRHLLDTFEKLAASRFTLLTYVYFFWNFVVLLGYGPELSRCVSCRGVLALSGLYFSNKEGGVVCSSCFYAKKDAVQIHPDTIKILRLIIKKEWEVLSKLKAKDFIKKSLKEISDQYYLCISNSYDR